MSGCQLHSTFKKTHKKINFVQLFHGIYSAHFEATRSSVRLKKSNKTQTKSVQGEPHTVPTIVSHHILLSHQK